MITVEKYGVTNKETGEVEPAPFFDGTFQLIMSGYSENRIVKVRLEEDEQGKVWGYHRFSDNTVPYFAGNEIGVRLHTGDLLKDALANNLGRIIRFNPIIIETNDIVHKSKIKRADNRR